ncbi:MAG: OmpA family protein [Myxococcales bacterium]|nr:OmpA family protein [Myxococcales bacterium]
MTLPLSWFALCSSVAVAQGFDAQRYTPPAGAAGGLVVERPYVPSNVSVGLYADAAVNPVVFRDNGEIVSRPLQSLVVLDVLASVAVAERLELAVGLPVAPLYSGDRFEQPQFAYQAVAGVGDVRITPKLALVGKARDNGGRVGLVVPVTLPSGNPLALRGSGGLSVTPTLLVGGRSDALSIHGSAGFRVRPDLDPLAPVGNEVTYGLGLAYEIASGPDTGTDLLLEASGASDVSRTGARLTDHPLELLGGVQWRPHRSWNVTVGFGPGLTSGLGTPDARWVLGLRYAPQAAVSSKPTENDRDGDRIRNDNDDCPDKPEDRDGFEDRDGCPDPDNDGDRIADDDDECPNEAEARGGDGDGCPDDGDVRRKANRIVFDGKIRFAFDRADISPRSKRLLDRIARVIKQLEDVRRVVIQGHTDAVGSTTYNDDLSQRRADSVRKALIARGIDAELLRTRGFGERRPIAPNDTPAGRARNRRVEFVLKE